MLVLMYNFGFVIEFCDYMVMIKGIVLVSGFIEIMFIVVNLEQVFSGVLCYIVLSGGEEYIIIDDECFFIFWCVVSGGKLL